MDYFCKNLIRAELDALMSVPVPKPEELAVSDDSNYIFEDDGTDIPGRSPNEWLQEDSPEGAMREALKAILGPKAKKRTRASGRGEERRGSERREIIVDGIGVVF
ncbi:hypothetical protein FRC11_001402, partial [Ceratobasidium sp. 423]